MDDNFFLIGKQYNFTAPQFSSREIDYGDPGHDLFLIKIMSRSNLIIFLEKGNIFCKMVVRNMYFLFFQLNGGGGEVISLLKENFITEPDRHTDLRPQ